MEKQKVNHLVEKKQQKDRKKGNWVDLGRVSRHKTQLCREGSKKKEVDLGRVSRHNNNNINNLYLPSLPSLPNFSDFKDVKIHFGDEIERIKPAVGEYKGRYFFGTKMLATFPEKQIVGKKERTVMIKKEETILITSEGEAILRNMLNDVEIPEMTNMEGRWEKTHIESYIEGMTEEFSAEQIFEEIKKQYEKYMDLQTKSDYSFFPIWDIGTYFFNLFNSYPYVHLFGYKNSGKTKIMDISRCISFNALQGSCLRPAVIYRMIEVCSPTLYLDEFEILEEKKRNKDDEEIILLLNSGYKKGGIVFRNEQIGKKWIPTPFEVYSPKMIANISGLFGALDSRCIKITLLRAKKDDIRANAEVKEKDFVWQDIRNKLYVFSLKNWKKVKYYYDNLKPIKGISNRDWELWKPILTIAKIISEDIFNELIKYAKLKINEKLVEQSTGDSWEDYLLDILYEKIDEERYYSFKEIKSWLFDKYFIEDEYFDKFSHQEVKKYKKYKPSSKWIGNSLRRLPNLQYRLVKGTTEVFLNEKIVLNIISRLKCDIKIKRNVEESLDIKE